MPVPRRPSYPLAMRVAGAQVNLTVGDLDGNEAKILAAMEWAEGSGADVLLLPEPFHLDLDPIRSLSLH